ncbi:MAG: hypothetical protein ACC652_01075 [Acidimicrobiales bacterium]
MAMNASHSAPTLGWLRATATGLGIAAYFVIFTIWIPSKVAKSGTVVSWDQLVQDIVVSGVWFVPLALLIVGLRKAQGRGLI